MNAHARGWCPRCSRRLVDVLVNLNGRCPVHGVVAAEWEPDRVVVAGDVLGVFLRGDEHTVVYRRDDGTTGEAPANDVDVVDAGELGGEW